MHGQQSDAITTGFLYRPKCLAAHEARDGLACRVRAQVLIPLLLEHFDILINRQLLFLRERVRIPLRTAKAGIKSSRAVLRNTLAMRHTGHIMSLDVSGKLGEAHDVVDQFVMVGLLVLCTPPRQVGKRAKKKGPPLVSGRPY